MKRPFHWILASVFSLTLGLGSNSASAQFGSDGPPMPPPGGSCMGNPGGCGPRGFGPGPHHAGGGVIEQLVDPCGATCHEQARACHQAAEEPMKSCGLSSCASEIAAAQAACPAGLRPGPDESESCRSAMGSVFSCMKPCFEEQRGAMEACRDQAQTCEDSCRSAATS